MVTHIRRGLGARGPDGVTQFAGLGARAAGAERALVGRMKFTHLIAALALASGVVACKKKEETKTDTTATTEAPKGTEAPKEAPKAAKGRKVPNGNGLVLDAPARWVDNGIGGAAGYHLDADAGGFQIRELEGEEATKSFADWKKESEEMLFQKWITAEETPDGGFTALYVIDSMKMKGEELVKDGSQFAFHVRKKVGGKTYYCYGTAKAEADAKEGLDLCTKFTAG